MIGWPLVFAELLAGIVVGPVLLGIVELNETIEILAEFGIFFLMLHSGLETDPKAFMRSGWQAFSVGIGDLTIAFLFGCVASIFFGYSLETAFFVGTATGATSIAVSSRLLKDFKLQSTKVGYMVKGATVFEDIAVLLLFGMLVNYHEVGTMNPQALLTMIGKIVLFFGVTIAAGLYLSNHLQRIMRRGNRSFTFILIIAFFFAWFAEFIGLHMIIGAFMAGLFIREEVSETAVFHKIEDRIFGLGYRFLGPIFFASLAFKIDFTVLTKRLDLVLGLFAAAVLGKIIGGSLMAIMNGYSIRKSILTGFAMNCRGAVDVIIASIGFSMGIIQQDLFSVLVLVIFMSTLFSLISTKLMLGFSDVKKEKAIT